MAESSWPSPDNARVIDDVQYEKLGLSYGPTAGVVGDFTNPQLVYGDSTGMQIKVAADRYALVRGHEWWSGPTIFTKAITSNSSGSTRTDLVVLRLARATWNVTVEVVIGTPGAGPDAPTWQTGTTGYFDLPLATVTVASGAATISAANVTYVGSHLCSDGSGVRAPSQAALTYIPLAFNGMQATLTDQTTYRYESGAWVDMYGWTAFTPVLYKDAGTGVTISSTNIRSKYRKIGKMVWAQAYTTANAASTGGLAITMPVAAPERLLCIGSMGVFGSSTPSDQCGIAVMGPNSPWDKIVLVSYSNGFRDNASGNTVRYNICYESAT